MSDSPFHTADWRKFAKHVNADLVPKLADSAATMALYTGADADVKQALEIGFTLLMGKPLILVVIDAATVPAKLRAIADAVIEVPLGASMTDHSVAEQIKAAMDRIFAEQED